MHQIQNNAAVMAISTCAAECESCAAHCIDDGNRPQCARLCLDCASACWETASALSFGTQFDAQRASLCATICDGCADECAKHDNEHCRHCSETCRKCAEECRYIHVTA
jgi:hypothetical protein